MPNPHKKPFIVALCFLIAGCLMLAAGPALVEITGSMGYYALIAFGVLSLIVAIVVYFAYRRLNREFRNMLESEPLLRFTADSHVLAQSVERSVRELKSENRAKLLIMLAFCALVAVVLPFLFEDGYLFIFIGIGMAALLSLSAWIITAYRVRKLQKGSNAFVLSPLGAYAGGEFHSWNTPETRLTGVHYRPPEDGEPGMIEIEYTAVSYPASAVQKVNIPIPGDQVTQAEELMRILEARRKG